MKQHILPLDTDVSVDHIYASSTGGDKPSKALRIQASDKGVFFVVTQGSHEERKELVRTYSKTFAIETYNSLP